MSMDVNKVDKLTSVVNRIASAQEELMRLEQFIDSSSIVRCVDVEKAAALREEIYLLEYVKEEILNG